MSFKGKVVIVTGASSGIGAATAIAFAAEGAKVVMVGRNTAKLNNVAATCEQKGSKPLVVVGDVSDDKTCERIINDTLKEYGKIDVLVNNAGMVIPAGILAPNAMDSFNKTIATNLRAVVYLTHLAAPHLVKNKGNIINISSVAGMKVFNDNSFAYNVSKAALDHFGRSIALELAPKGVRVNTVNPGLVRTDILADTPEKRDAIIDKVGKLTPMGRAGEPEEIADVITFLASDKARSITGSSYVSDNGSLLSGPVRLDI